jgi:hypothetical protein
LALTQDAHLFVDDILQDFGSLELKKSSTITECAK